MAILTVEVAVYSKDPYDFPCEVERILHTEVADDGAYIQRANHHQRLKGRINALIEMRNCNIHVKRQTSYRLRLLSRSRTGIVAAEYLDGLFPLRILVMVYEQNDLQSTYKYNSL
jgi:hypothetical protein